MQPTHHGSPDQLYVDQRPGGVRSFVFRMTDGAFDAPAAEWDLADQFPKATHRSTKKGGAIVRPLFSALPAKDLEALVRRGRAMDQDYEPPDLNQYYLVHTASPETATELMRTLRREPDVLYAAAAPLPTCTPSMVEVPSSSEFRWLHTQPDGVGAEPVWSTPAWADLLGAGVHVRVIDRGVKVSATQVDHPDIDGTKAGLTGHPGMDATNARSDAEEQNHGLMSVGVLMAGIDALAPPPADEQLPLGLVPHCDAVTVYPIGPHTQSATEDMANTIAALLHAIQDAEAGDILLLELQISPTKEVDGVAIPLANYVPVEVFEPYYRLVRLATALSIVTVEPSGNGAHDLDTGATIPWATEPSLIDPNVHDSGAIMVATAAQAPATSSWYAANTFGSRIDCFAAGGNTSSAVGTTGFLGGTFNKVGFTGSSAAAAVVAGVAAVLQGKMKAALGLLSPLQMRGVLSDPALGTSPDPANTLPIGVMPDLSKAVPALADAPDLVIRDEPADDGSPRVGTCQSPDILVSLDGDPAPTDSGTGSIAVTKGSDHQVHLRVFNRGGSNATAATGTVYYSVPATLITPDDWTPIGSAGFPTVPPSTAASQTTSEAIPWPDSEIPGNGHYCFIAVVGDPSDPAPPIPATDASFDWQAWLDFVGNNNNVAWRNFNVETISSGESKSNLKFLMRGAPDRRRHFTLELETHLPPGARVWFHTGGRLLTKARFPGRARRLRRARGLKVVDGIRLGRAPVPAGAEWPMEVRVTWPRRMKQGDWWVSVRQLFREREVGRVTWQLRPPRCKG